MFDFLNWSFERLSVGTGILVSVYILARVIALAFFKTKSNFEKENNSGSKR